MHKVFDFLLMLLFIVASIWILAGVLNIVSYNQPQPTDIMNPLYLLAINHKEINSLITWETFNEITHAGDNRILLNTVSVPTYSRDENPHPSISLKSVLGFYIPDMYAVNARILPRYNSLSDTSICEYNPRTLTYSFRVLSSKYRFSLVDTPYEMTNTELQVMLNAHKLLMTDKTSGYTFLYLVDNNIYLVHRVSSEGESISLIQTNINDIEPKVEDVFEPKYYGFTFTVYAPPDITYIPQSRSYIVGDVVPLTITYYDKVLTEFEDKPGLVFNIKLWGAG